MSCTILQINEFINRAELEIIDKIEYRFNLILNDCIQKLKSFSTLCFNNFDDLLSNKLSFQTNRSLTQCINELSHCFWYLIEIMMEFSYYIQQRSENDLDKLNMIEILLISNIDFLNKFHQRRCDILNQSDSAIKIDFDKRIYQELRSISMEICKKLSEISLPNNTSSIIRNT